MPIDTSDVKLSDELSELAELLARNVHDNWASSRIKEGWEYGACRDDVLKHHPCLVVFDDLPEAEKAYDRKTAIESIKVIVKMGYCIK